MSQTLITSTATVYSISARPGHRTTSIGVRKHSSYRRNLHFPTEPQDMKDSGSELMKPSIDQVIHMDKLRTHSPSEQLYKSPALPLGSPHSIHQRAHPTAAPKSPRNRNFPRQPTNMCTILVSPLPPNPPLFNAPSQSPRAPTRTLHRRRPLLCYPVRPRRGLRHHALRGAHVGESGA